MERCEAEAAIWGMRPEPQIKYDQNRKTQDVGITIGIYMDIDQCIATILRVRTEWRREELCILSILPSLHPTMSAYPILESRVLLQAPKRSTSGLI